MSILSNRIFTFAESKQGAEVENDARGSVEFARGPATPCMCLGIGYRYMIHETTDIRNGYTPPSACLQQRNQNLGS